MANCANMRSLRNAFLIPSIFVFVLLFSGCSRNYDYTLTVAVTTTNALEEVILADATGRKVSLGGAPSGVGKNFAILGTKTCPPNEIFEVACKAPGKAAESWRADLSKVVKRNFSGEIILSVNADTGILKVTTKK
ncbi:MAG TPA: hypothetical protein VGH19_22660 [Verrucomicrobiae bacterium]